MNRILRIAGVAALVIGLLWAGQGAGLVQWPAGSQMIDQRPWIGAGLGLAILGIAALIRAARRP